MYNFIVNPIYLPCNCKVTKGGSGYALANPKPSGIEIQYEKIQRQEYHIN